MAAAGGVGTGIGSLGLGSGRRLAFVKATRLKQHRRGVTGLGSKTNKARVVLKSHKEDSNNVDTSSGAELVPYREYGEQQDVSTSQRGVVGNLRSAWIKNRKLQSACLGLASLALFDLVLAQPSHALEHFGSLFHSVPSLGAQSLYVPGLVGDDEFREGFTSGLLLILVSEIGDKTFFVAMLLAVRQSDTTGSGSGSNLPKSDKLALEEGSSGALDQATTRRLVVYTGTVGALALMTVISCGIGRTFHSLDELFANYIPSGLSTLPLDDVAAVVLLTSFGITSLRDAQAMEDKPETNSSNSDTTFTDVRSSNEDEESEEEGARRMVKEMEDEGKISEEQSNTSLLLQTFLLVFAAEWGDRSFLSTIALTAAYPPLAVVAGATMGHGVATALAIGGGSVLAKYISEKTIAYTAGVLFLAFATATVIDLFAGNHLITS